MDAVTQVFNAGMDAFIVILQKYYFVAEMTYVMKVPALVKFSQQ